MRLIVEMYILNILFYNLCEIKSNKMSLKTIDFPIYIRRNKNFIKMLESAQFLISSQKQSSSS